MTLLLVKNESWLSHKNDDERLEIGTEPAAGSSQVSTQGPNPLLIESMEPMELMET